MLDLFCRFEGENWQSGPKWGQIYVNNKSPDRNFPRKFVNNKSPELEFEISNTKGGVYYHELIRVAPGQAKTYLSMMEELWIPVADRLGLKLCFAGRSMMVNESEVICIWAIKDWPAWANVEKAYESDPAVAVWRKQTQHIALDWRNKLLADGPLNPMNTGVLLPRPE